MNFETKSLLVGIAGDLALQMITYQRGELVGLKSYFDQHGKVESLMIAGGLMYSNTLLYQQTGLPTSNVNLFQFNTIYNNPDNNVLDC